jgi:hypothetical protein
MCIHKKFMKLWYDAKAFSSFNIFKEQRNYETPVKHTYASYRILYSLLTSSLLTWQTSNPTTLFKGQKQKPQTENTTLYFQSIWHAFQRKPNSFIYMFISVVI